MTIFVHTCSYELEKLSNMTRKFYNVMVTLLSQTNSLKMVHVCCKCGGL